MGLNLGAPKTEETETKQTTESATESVAVDDRVIYSSHPILNLRIGPYQFTNGRLMIEPEKEEAFDTLLAGFPGNAGVRKIDVAAANEMAVEFLRSRTVRGVDTSEDRPN